MPQHTINLLEDLLKNGADEDTKVLGAGIKATLEHVSDIQEDIGLAMDAVERLAKSVNDHIKNKECHTPKGLLVRGNVLAWFMAGAVAVFSLLYIVASVLGIEELLKTLIP